MLVIHLWQKFPINSGEDGNYFFLLTYLLKILFLIKIII